MREMKFSNFVSLQSDPRSQRSCLCSIVPTVSLICFVLFIGITLIASDSKENIWMMTGNIQSSLDSLDSTGSSQGLKSDKCKNSEVIDKTQEPTPNKCENKCRPIGSESLPKGMVEATSSLEMRPLWGFPEKAKSPVNLLALPVGIKQKFLVNKMVEKFLLSGFVVMLFHYDGVVDKWKEFEWSNRVIHVSAMNQTKWWFAKRFLHPDIVAEYSYIFIWDEDLGLEHFDPDRYLSIVKEEGLEISQPGLDRSKSEMHHLITVRNRNSIVHRRIYKTGGRGKPCDNKSTDPPCTGWIEMMAPVFSKGAWPCVWYMIQNDLIHAWGLDMQLGYCAQGDRTQKVGVVDAEYIVHLGIPSLGGDDQQNASAAPHVNNDRLSVRRQSFVEMDIFRDRWSKAADEDQCWVDPYPKLNQTLI